MNKVDTNFLGEPVERPLFIAELHGSGKVLRHPMMRTHLAQTPQNWSSVKQLSVILCHRIGQCEMIFERGQRRGTDKRPICTLKLIRIIGSWPRLFRWTTEVTIDNAFVQSSRKSLEGLTPDERAIVRYVRFYLAKQDARQAQYRPRARQLVRRT